jgi:hypothetical protein
LALPVDFFALALVLALLAGFFAASAGANARDNIIAARAILVLIMCSAF